MGWSKVCKGPGIEDLSAMAQLIHKFGCLQWLWTCTNMRLLLHIQYRGRNQLSNGICGCQGFMPVLA